MCRAMFSLISDKDRRNTELLCPLTHSILKQVMAPSFERIDSRDDHMILYKSGGETLLPTTFCINRGGDPPPIPAISPKTLFGKGGSPPDSDKCVIEGDLITPLWHVIAPYAPFISPF